MECSYDFILNSTKVKHTKGRESHQKLKQNKISSLKPHSHDETHRTLAKSPPVFSDQI